MIDFNRTHEVDFSIKNVRHEFDVRSNASTTNDFAVKQLVQQEKIFRLPLLTEDGVLVEGRHAFDASIQMAANASSEEKAPKVETVRVRVLTNVYYSKLTSTEKIQLIALAGTANMGQHGFQQLGTAEDFAFQVEQMISLGASSDDVIRLYAKSGYSNTRIKQVFGEVTNAIRSQKIALARNYLHDNPRSSPAAAAKKFGIAAKYIGSIIANKFKTTSKRSFKAMRGRQTELDRAVAAVGRYANSNLKAVTAGGMSAKMAVDLADYQLRTAHRILDKAQEARDYTQKEIDKREAVNHRF